MDSKIKNYGKTFADLKVDSSISYIYKNNNIENTNIINFKDLRFGIDSINNYSNKGLYYINPLIFAISNKNYNMINQLLELGSAPRGYSKYPGYPLYKAIEVLNYNSYNKLLNNPESEDYIISIIKLLINYGARFDDFIVNVYWSRFNQTLDYLNDDNKEKLLSLYKSSPFNVKKYKIYLSIYCEDASLITLEEKNNMFKKFCDIYVKNKSTKFGLKLFFLYK